MKQDDLLRRQLHIKPQFSLLPDHGRLYADLRNAPVPQITYILRRKFLRIIQTLPLPENISAVDPDRASLDPVTSGMFEAA